MREEAKEVNFQNDNQPQLNGDAEKASSSRFSSLLESNDRDYLLSSTGNKVYLTPLSLSLMVLDFVASV